MSIQRVIGAALELRGRLEEIGLPYCFIGGVAVHLERFASAGAIELASCPERQRLGFIKAQSIALERHSIG